MSEASDRLQPIDGLRAIAMTLVVAQHCKLAPFGWIGVWLFYVISGFVITRGLLPGVGQAPGPAYSAFLKRRFFRIVPAYLVYIAINLVVMAAAGRTSGARDLPFLLTFTFNWQMIFQIWPTPNGWSAFGHLWTLSVEEQFYLVFPLLFLRLRREPFVLLAALLIAAGPVIRLGASFWLSAQPEARDPNWSAYAIYAASFTQFDAFLMGALLALFEPTWRRNALLRSRLYRTAAAMLLIYLAVYGIMNMRQGATGIDLVRNLLSGILYGGGREVVVYSVVDALCVCLIVAALSGHRFAGVLGRPALTYVGRVSYSAYLYHALVLWLLGTLVMPAGFDALPAVPRILWFGLAWAITVSLASLSYYGLERPIIRWHRTLATPSAHVPLAEPGRLSPARLSSTET